jgi:hypothetical protein
MALALGGRPAARLARRLRVEVSRSTLLRLLRALPVPEVGSLAAVGVDDFAFRRGHTYGTVLVDMHTHQPVELLADRLSDTFADWLRTHPGAEIICRDRAGSYAEGARIGAPDAVQVADRWHLLHNLSDAVDRVARTHRGCLRQQTEHHSAQPAAAPPRPTSAGTKAQAPAPVSGRRAQVTRQRHGEVHALLEQGMSLNAISKELRLQRNTLRSFQRLTLSWRIFGRDRVNGETTGVRGSAPRQAGAGTVAGRVRRTAPVQCRRSPSAARPFVKVAATPPRCQPAPAGKQGRRASVGRPKGPTPGGLNWVLWTGTDQVRRAARPAEHVGKPGRCGPTCCSGSRCF